ncbi:MAG: carbohydrate ABC transporter permease [Elusimicrobiota bacterium]|nr:carbohydrate ABC transporter permease [Elusimicrobiota bacterium]
MIKLFKSVCFITFFVFTGALFLAPLKYAVFAEVFRAQKALNGYSPAAFFDFFWDYAAVLYKSGFLEAFVYSLFITIFSTWAIIIFTSMAAWMLVRLNNKFNTFLYYCFIFSMAVPYPLLMWTSPKTAAFFHLANPFGIIVLYLGFGAGLTVFLYGTFIKRIPKEIEEAAFMDGCSVRAVFFNVTMPILSPVTMAAIIFNVLWIWNDYLMPSLIIGQQYKTLPILIQNIASNPQEINYLPLVLFFSLYMPLLFFAAFKKNILKAFSTGIQK